MNDYCCRGILEELMDNLDVNKDGNGSQEVTPRQYDSQARQTVGARSRSGEGSCPPGNKL